MTGAIDPVALAQRLIACASVTPADAGAQELLAGTLAGLGFRVERLVFGGLPDGPVTNLFATIGERAALAPGSRPRAGSAAQRALQ